MQLTARGQLLRNANWGWDTGQGQTRPLACVAAYSHLSTSKTGQLDRSDAHGLGLARAVMINREPVVRVALQVDIARASPLLAALAEPVSQWSVQKAVFGRFTENCDLGRTEQPLFYVVLLAVVGQNVYMWALM